tara:strand:+ start:271 stop:447 length:177 start_codon:yes stop_codon:yes gene_type:complete
MKQAFMTIRLNVDNEDEINPYHLCEEMQAYLNNHSNTKIDGYIFEYDKFNPFIPKDDY